MFFKAFFSDKYWALFKQSCSKATEAFKTHGYLDQILNVKIDSFATKYKKLVTRMQPHLDLKAMLRFGASILSIMAPSTLV
jgi:hypothetical protein